jgi:hypothetical protein
MLDLAQMSEFSDERKSAIEEEVLGGKILSIIDNTFK